MRILVLLVLAAAPPAVLAQDLETRLESLVKPYVDGKLTVGMAVGTIVRGESRVRGYGRVRPTGDAAPDGRTVYEIGSLTKVFNGVLLALAAERGEVALDDPLRKHLPKGVSLDEDDEHPVRLVHLATHTSGLPRLPAGFRPRNPLDPYADFDAARLAKAVNDTEIMTTPGTAYAYSNYGAGLLGDVLRRRARAKDYDGVLKRVTGPLKLKDTRCRPSRSMKDRLAPPYAAGGVEQTSWTFDALAGAGAARSTVDDLLAFARATLSRDEKTPLFSALATARRRHFRGKQPMGLGWHRRPDGAVWHAGATGGYRSLIVVDPGNEVAVVTLTNSNSAKLEALDVAIIRAVTAAARK